MWDFEVEDLPFLISFDQVIASMQLIFDGSFAVLAPQRVRIAFFSFFWVHSPYYSFPLGDRISFATISVDKDHHEAFPAHHVPQNVLEVGLIFVFIEDVDDLFFEEFPLEHIFDGELFPVFDEVYDLLEFFGLEDCVRFDNGNCEGQVNLFGIE